MISTPNPEGLEGKDNPAIMNTNKKTCYRTEKILQLDGKIPNQLHCCYCNGQKKAKGNTASKTCCQETRKKKEKYLETMKTQNKND